MIIADNGIIIRIKAEEISKISRNTKGVRIMRMKGEGNVVCVAVAPPEPDEEEMPEGETAVDGENTAAETAPEITEKTSNDESNE